MALDDLGARGIGRLVAEGGGTIHTQFLTAGMVDEIQLAIARRSDLKDVTPDAVDISDLAAAKEAANRAENERRIVEMERKRLRTEEADRESR